MRFQFLPSFLPLIHALIITSSKQFKLSSLDSANGNAQKIEVCPDGCLCRPKARQIASGNTQFDQINSPEEMIDQFNWTAKCENLGISSFNPGIGAEISFSLVSLPRKTVELSLRGNSLTFLRKNSFRALPNLEKLDLSENRIAILGSEAFADLKNLKILNLTSNRLHTLNASMFVGLDNLKKLYLGDNPLPFIPAGSLKKLEKLNFLDISSKVLTCDCNMRWLWKKVRKEQLELSENSVCVHPKKFRGITLNKIKRKDLKCGKFVPKLFEMEPAEEARLVFPGDSLSVSCRIGTAEHTNVSLEWFHSKVPVSGNPNFEKKVEKVLNKKEKILESKIQFDQIEAKDAGLWTCRAETLDVGAAERQLELIVMAAPPINSGSCPPDVSSNEKGNFSWPETKAGTAAKKPCPFGTLLANCTRMEPKCMAQRVCGANSVWKPDVKSDACEFASELIQYGRKMLYGKDSMVELSRKIRWEKFENLTKFNFSKMTSPEEIDFLTKFLENEGSQGYPVEIRAFSNILAQNSASSENETDLFRSAEKQFNSSTRLRKWISEFTPDSLVVADSVLTSENIGICENTVRQTLHAPTPESPSTDDVTSKSIASFAVKKPLIDAFYAAAYDNLKSGQRTFFCGQLTRDIVLRRALSVVEFPSKLVKVTLAGERENVDVKHEQEDFALSDGMPMYLSFLWLRTANLFQTGTDLAEIRPRRSLAGGLDKSSLTRESLAEMWTTESQILGVKAEKLSSKLNFMSVTSAGSSRKEKRAVEMTDNSTDNLTENNSNNSSSVNSAAENPEKTLGTSFVVKRFVKFWFTIREKTPEINLGFWNESGTLWAPIDAATCWVQTKKDVAGGSIRIGFFCDEDKFARNLLHELVMSNDGKTSKYAFFTVVQLRSELLKIREVKEPIQLLPWMYAGSGLLSICLLVAVICYSCCARAIEISTKLRHCLVNSWISITVLCLTFTLGIDRLEIHPLCFAVSVTLHYMFLVGFLWTVLTLRTIQRKMWKIVNPPAPSEEDGPPGEVPKHGPLVGLYFMAWGVPVMPTAFSLALKMDAYSSEKAYCFLPPGGVLYGALLVPAGIILLAALILLISGCCLCSSIKKNNAHNRIDVTGACISPVSDESSMLLVQQNGKRPLNGVRNLNRRDPEAISLASSAVDNELAADSQLCYAAAVMVLYLLTCCAAAAYFLRPTDIFVMLPSSYYAEITSGIYACLLALLSLTVFFCYVALRPNLRGKICERRSSNEEFFGVSARENNARNRGKRKGAGKSGRRDVGVGMATTANGSGGRNCRPKSIGATSAGSFVITPESEKMMKAMARRYHNKRRHDSSLDDPGDPFGDGVTPPRGWGYGMNGSAVMPSDIASEIIFEEEELAYIPSPTESSHNHRQQRKIPQPYLPHSTSRHSQKSSSCNEGSRHSSLGRNGVGWGEQSTSCGKKANGIMHALSPEHQALLQASSLSEPSPARTTTSSGCLAPDRMTRSDGAPVIDPESKFHDYVNVKDLSPCHANHVINDFVTNDVALSRNGASKRENCSRNGGEKGNNCGYGVNNFESSGCGGEDVKMRKKKSGLNSGGSEPSSENWNQHSETIV